MHRLKLLAALASLLALALPTSLRAADDNAHGLPLIRWASEVGEDRYRSARDFASTVKWYHKLFVGNRHVKEYREVNLPGVKYVHFSNRNPKSKWSGFNIYQKGARGEVRIYVLKALPKPGDAADKNDQKAKPKKAKKAKKTK